MITKICKTIYYVALLFVLILVVPQTFASSVQKINNPSYFLGLADIHFDPFIACHNRASCLLINKLQHAPVEKWEGVLVQYDKTSPQFNQDTNYPLLKSALAAAKKTADAQHIRFVLVLGDFLGHDFKDQFELYSADKTSAAYRAFVNKTMQFLTHELAQAFPATDVYAVVGNNDSYQDDYVATPNGKFFHDMASLWSRLIKNKDNRIVMQREFTQGGYYAVDVPDQKDLRLIVLNSVLFSKNVRGRGTRQAANKQLDWLHKQLEAVHDNKQHAIIVLHIPTGIDIYASLNQISFSIIEFWLPQYTQRFQDDLKLFASDIIGILPAHLHADWFQILLPSNFEKISVVATPSISPIFGNNPAFKMYNYNQQPLQLGDFETYYYSINRQSGWSREYLFSRIYNPLCQKNCRLIDGIERLKKTGDLAKHYKFYYSVSTNSQPITTKWIPYYWCALRTILPVDYQNCINKIM